MAKISSDFISDLSDTDLRDVFDAMGIKYKKGKGDHIVMSCITPSHKDQTPSFSANTATGAFFCQGCNCSGGGAIHAYAAHHGKDTQRDFVEIVENLSSLLGKQIIYDHSPEDNKRRDIVQALTKAVPTLVPYFEEDKQAVGNYLRERGISPETVDFAKIGFMPRNFPKSPVAKQYQDSLIQAGVLRKDKESGNIYSPLAGRLIFPIADEKDRVVALAGRKIDESKSGPKYKNTDDTPVFKKSSILYGLNRAVKSLEPGKKFDRLIISEGYMDSITGQRNGFPEVVATMGTAMTTRHFKKLSRFTDTAVFVFDPDEAGYQASEKALLNGLPFAAQTNMQFVFMPTDGDKKLDPDEFIKTKGAEAFEQHLSTAIDLPTMASRYVLGRNPESLMKLLLGGVEERGRKVFNALPPGITRSLFTAQVAADASKILDLSISPEHLGMTMDRDLEIAALQQVAFGEKTVEEVRETITKPVITSGVDIANAAVSAPAPVQNQPTSEQATHTEQQAINANLEQSRQALNEVASTVPENEASPSVQSAPPGLSQAEEQPYIDANMEIARQALNEASAALYGDEDIPFPDDVPPPEEPAYLSEESLSIGNPVPAPEMNETAEIDNTPAAKDTTTKARNTETMPLPAFFKHMQLTSPRQGDWIAIPSGKLMQVRGFTPDGIACHDTKNNPDIYNGPLLRVEPESVTKARFPGDHHQKGDTILKLDERWVSILPAEYVDKAIEAFSIPEEIERLRALALLTVPPAYADDDNYILSMRVDLASLPVEDLRDITGQKVNPALTRKRTESATYSTPPRPRKSAQEKDSTDKKKRTALFPARHIRPEKPAPEDWVLLPGGVLANVGSNHQLTAVDNTPLFGHSIDQGIKVKPDAFMMSKKANGNWPKGTLILKMAGSWVSDYPEDYYDLAQDLLIIQGFAREGQSALESKVTPDLRESLTRIAAQESNASQGDLQQKTNSELLQLALPGKLNQTSKPQSQKTASKNPGQGEEKHSPGKGKDSPSQVPTEALSHLDTSIKITGEMFITSKALGGELYKLESLDTNASTVTISDPKTGEMQTLPAAPASQNDALVLAKPQAKTKSRFDSDIAKEGDLIFKFSKESPWIRELPKEWIDSTLNPEASLESDTGMTAEYSP